MAKNASHQPTPEAVLALDGEHDPGRLAEQVSERFGARTRVPREHVRTYLDTPDWRIQRWGGELSRTEIDGEPHLELVDENGRFTVEARNAPAFASDLPDPLRGVLGAVVDVRRILPQVEVHSRTTDVDVLDDLGRDAVRLHIEQCEALSTNTTTPRALESVVRVSSVRGNGTGGEREAVEAFLRDELGLGAAEPSALRRALAALERDPDREVLSWTVDLDPREPAGQAVRRVLQRFARILAANEVGVLADLDTEFLHDFRVAIRRTRSVLAQFRNLWPEDQVAHFLDEFAWLGQLTTHARDMDVFLLRLRERSEAGEDLDELMEYLRERREHERTEMVLGLKLRRFRELESAWRAFLSPARLATDKGKARKPIGPLASRRIDKLARRVVERADAIRPDGSAGDLHALRIRCKKLRYAIDAFSSLYGADDVARATKPLRRLLRGLGDFNDLRMERATLERLALEMEGASPATLLAIGRTLERFEGAAEAMRPALMRRIERFTADKARGRIQALVAGASDA